MNLNQSNWISVVQQYFHNEVSILWLSNYAQLSGKNALTLNGDRKINYGKPLNGDAATNR